MKKTMMLLALAALTLAAQAQKFYARPYNHPRLIVTTGVYAPAYPYGLYGPFYPYGYAAPVRTSRLELKLEDIRTDYQDRIRSARHDHSLSRGERKKTIRDLKNERDREIKETRRNYYKTKP